MASDRRGWTDHFIVLAIALVATLPWLDKAFHIDDVLYLTVADQIRKTPLMPYGDKDKTVVLWDAENGQPASLFRTDFNPPLWKYILAAGIEAFGRDERGLHLISAAIVVAAAWGIYFASLRWTTRPLWCVAMVLWGPFFLPGQNLMIEPLILCLMSWAAYFMQRSWDRGRTWSALVAGALVGLAVLTKYTCGLFLGIFAIGSILHGRRNSLAFLLPAGGLLGLWMMHNELVYGAQHITSHGVVFKSDQWHVRVLVVLRIIGAVSLFWPLWIAALWSRGFRWRLAICAIVCVSGLVGWLDLLQAQATFRDWGRSARTGIQWHFVLFTSLGALTVLSYLAETFASFRADRQSWLADKTDRTLDFWIAAILAFNVASVPFNAVRHLLFFFLAMTWRTARASTGGSTRLPATCLLLSACLGFLLAAADQEFADKHRDFARSELKRDVETHRRVWYTGNWGWVYYALEQGARPYLEAPHLWGLGNVEPGDRIHDPVFLNWQEVNPYSNRLQELKPRILESQWPIRTIVVGAHYYGILSHTLPWEVSIRQFDDGHYHTMPLDVIHVFDVLPRAPGVHPP